MTIFISSIYSKRNIDLPDVGLPGDVYDQSIGFHCNFVFCRDHNGNSTAIYGSDIWDLNPYRTSPKPVTPIDFSRIDKEVRKADACEYKSQVKNILALLIHTRGGKLGKVAASTLVEYFKSMVDLVKFCEFHNSNNSFGQKMYIYQLLSNSTFCQSYLDRAMEQTRGYKHKSKQLKSILNLLNNVDRNQLGFCPASTRSMDVIREENQGHPVIPCRIYMNLLDILDTYSKVIFEHRDKLRDWILKCKDYDFSIGQNSKGELIFELEWQKSGLDSLARALGIECKERATTVKLISFIQYILKNHIHAYTGMRDQEANRIKPGCIFDVERDNHEDMIDEYEEVVMFQVISSTSKFTGTLTKGSWLAPNWILSSIESLEVICEALCQLYKVNYTTDVNLLIGPGIIRSKKYSRVSPACFSNNGPLGFMTHLCKLHPGRLTLNSDDYKELVIANENINFNNRAEFKVGEPWTLSSHQWRRSLAFYGANSKLIDFPSLAAQFKQLSIEMAKYYARGSANFLRIFLGENYKNKMIDRGHVMFDYKMAIPLAVVENLISDIFLSQDTVFGSVGSYASQQQDRFVNGDISIRELREETYKEVKSGSISYRETLLGGCTSTEPCNRYLAGNITACFPCDRSVIKKDNLDKFINQTKRELSSYDRNSAEYVITKNDLIAALNYRKRKTRI